MTDRPASFSCPYCGGQQNKVVDTRPLTRSDEAIRRRRECLSPRCHKRFTTYERLSRSDAENLKHHNI